MTEKEILIQEIEQAPEEMVRQILDFVRFLRTMRVQGLSENPIASESALTKDWSSPGEDEAWEHL